MRLRWRCGVLAAGAMLAGCSGSAPPEGRDLAVGATIERDLQGKVVHRYRVTLHGGRGVEVVATQLSVDVALTLVDPGGATVSEESRRTSGEEILLAAVAADGIHELRVQATGDKLPRGRYRLIVREVPPGEPRFAVLERHRTARRQSDDGEARRQLTAAREAWEVLGDPRMAAVALVEIGDRGRKLRKPAEAVQAFGEASRRFAALGFQDAHAQAESLAGESHLERGDFRAAAERFRAALPFEAALTPGDRVGLRYSLATCRLELGDDAAALPEIRRAVDEFQALGMNDEELIARTALVDFFITRRELPPALAEASQGALLSQTYGKPGQEARFLQRLGIVYAQAGDDEAAAEHWRRALALHSEAGNRTGEAAVLLQLSDLTAKLGDVAEAERTYRKALETFRVIGQRVGEARTLRRLGDLLTDRGAHTEAAELQEQSLSILRDLGSTQGQVLTMAALAEARAGEGKSAVARRLLLEALDLSRTSAAGLHEAQILGALARLDRDRGALKQALAGLDATIELLEAEQREALVPSLQATLSGDARIWYAERTDLLMRLKQPERALECSERARARALLGLLAESRVDLRQGVDAGLLERYRAVEVKLSEADRARSAEVSQLTTELHALQTEIRRASPAYAALTQPTPLSVKEIQERVLDEETLLLEFSLGETRSWLFVLGRDGLETAPLPAAAEIEAAAAALHRRLSAREPGEAEAADLAAMLLRPIAARLSGPWRARRLAIVPDGALQYVPFAALPVGTPARPLIEHHEIVVLPSASALDVLRREFGARPRAPLAVALLADPVFDAEDPRVRRAAGAPSPAAIVPGGMRGFPRLPFSRDEVKGIAALLPRDQVLQATDFSASRVLAMDGTLGRYRAVHIATHGLLNTTRPELSGVVLSLVDEDGRPQDGFLRLQDIYNLRLSADLVVLSACQTALGRSIAGEGLVGLTRGFMHAGAPRVVASLWKVDDSATAELMKELYRGMIGDGATAAHALRAAQRKLAQDRRFASPFFWAGFTLQGDWR